MYSVVHGKEELPEELGKGLMRRLAAGQGKGVKWYKEYEKVSCKKRSRDSPRLAWPTLISSSKNASMDEVKVHGQELVRPTDRELELLKVVLHGEAQTVKLICSEKVESSGSGS